MARKCFPGPLLIALCVSASAGAEILASDGFESGNLGFRNGEFAWGDSNGFAGCRPEVTREVAHSGRHSLKFIYKASPSGEDAWSEQRFKLTRSLPEVYIQWYQLFPKGSEGLGPRWKHRKDPQGQSNNKFLRVWADEYNSATVKAGMSFWPNGDGDSDIVPDFGKDGTVSPLSSKGLVAFNDAMRGRWVKYQAHIRIDEGSGNGLVELWVDDKKVLTASGIAAYPAAGTGNYFRNGYLMGWANSGFDDNEYTYIDDVTISTQFIGNNPPEAPQWIGVTPKG